MNSTDTPTLLDALQRLLAELEAEDAALRALDLAAIDEATLAKVALEPELSHALAQPLPDDDAARRALARLRDDVKNRARANHRRLRASLVAVTDLVDELTGTTRTTYGRNLDGPVRALLTQTIG
jgi:hypothetical protein